MMARRLLLVNLLTCMLEVVKRMVIVHTCDRDRVGFQLLNDNRVELDRVNILHLRGGSVERRQFDDLLNFLEHRVIMIERAEALLDAVALKPATLLFPCLCGDVATPRLNLLEKCRHDIDIPADQTFGFPLRLWIFVQQCDQRIMQTVFAATHGGRALSAPSAGAWTPTAKRHPVCLKLTFTFCNDLFFARGHPSTPSRMNQ